MKHPKNREQGSIIVSILVITLFLTTLIYSLIVLANVNLTRARGRILLLQAQYAAESGADAAIAILNNTNSSYTGSSAETQVVSNTQYKATFATTVVNGSTAKERTVTAIGRVYAPANASTAKYTRKIEVVVQRTSTTSASSLISRNILDIASSVKDITAVDIHLNGYINMAKNTNNLIAENITVAGKNTSASNCSIGGSGSLSKPSSFTTAGQTKTNLTLAYNNCVNPPGNSSNTNFTVTANQGTISTISSTYIPWTQYMDTSYQSSPTGCGEWTSGASNASITIPNTGNIKKTHYPDTGSSTVSTCGSSGDLALGSRTYTIKDHVHIRASLCAASACTPTFFNPDQGAAGIKFIFVEGSINFGGVQTGSGSGPIVLVAYGSDPPGIAGACPDGGAIHLSNSGNTSAPALYLLANNGLCLDGTKFGSASGLGGLSGKNIYIASSSGTPFDLGLSSSFPSNAIPIDLAWKAVRYRRL